MKKLALYKCFNPRTHTGYDLCEDENNVTKPYGFNPRTHTGYDRCRV